MEDPEIIRGPRDRHRGCPSEKCGSGQGKSSAARRHGESSSGAAPLLHPVQVALVARRNQADRGRRQPAGAVRRSGSPSARRWRSRCPCATRRPSCRARRSPHRARACAPIAGASLSTWFQRRPPRRSRVPARLQVAAATPGLGPDYVSLVDVLLCGNTCVSECRGGGWHVRAVLDGRRSRGELGLSGSLQRWTEHLRAKAERWVGWTMTPGGRGISPRAGRSRRMPRARATDARPAGRRGRDNLRSATDRPG